jgi:hypothetical protein
LGEKNLESGLDHDSKSVDKAVEKPFGWVGRRRWALQVLEEAIENAREMASAKTGRGHDSSSRLEWSKTLMRLLELYDGQLTEIKNHIWGHTGPGSDKDEVADSDNGFIEFERLFQGIVLESWTSEHLKLKCVDCGVSSQQVSEQAVYKTAYDYDHLNLCPDCYAKRKAAEPPEEEDDDEEGGESN